jgi:hypothetical protein
MLADSLMAIVVEKAAEVQDQAEEGAEEGCQAVLGAEVLAPAAQLQSSYCCSLDLHWIHQQMFCSDGCTWHWHSVTVIRPTGCYRT